jgi:hypothetical protein
MLTNNKTVATWCTNFILLPTNALTLLKVVVFWFTKMVLLGKNVESWVKKTDFFPTETSLICAEIAVYYDFEKKVLQQKSYSNTGSFFIAAQKYFNLWYKNQNRK